MSIVARVQNGRIVVDAPTELPEGTIVRLIALEDVEALGEDEHAALLRSLDEGREDVERGDTEDALAFARQLLARA